MSYYPWRRVFSSVKLSLQIRNDIQKLYEKIESIPIVRAMLSGAVTREEYIHLTAQLLILHEVMEELIGRHSSLQKIADVTALGAQLIRRDLLRLGVYPSSSIKLQAAVINFMTDINRWAKSQPWCLVGALYIIEGSRMSSVTIAAPIAQALGVPCELGYGLDYHLRDLQRRPQTWLRFQDVIDEVCLITDIQTEVRQGATHTMRVLYDIYVGVRAPDTPSL